MFGFPLPLLVSTAASGSAPAVSDVTVHMSSAAADVTVPVMLNATDPDGDDRNLRVTGVTQPSGGGSTFIAVNSRAVRYSRGSAGVGNKVFTVTIRDEDSDTAEMTVTIDVTGQTTAQAWSDGTNFDGGIKWAFD